ncbi:putative serine/threonine-protein kinase pats1 [Stylophora pistillata]|uniref:Putative serine/threonine-protein kinase pats1 n=1 Tax=Stylophora pistillata TaxID=50429 RepID=A0A2B4R794_STYPI|nr:putative serine/threonine-protein kinase pats1 [Stylophora pistillata]
MAEESVADVTEQILQNDLEDDREDIYSITWDFAGQSVYYVTHPIFLTRRAIYLLVNDLRKNPSDKAIPLVKQGVYKEIEDKYNYDLKTNFDYLEFWMGSLASLVEQGSRPHESTEKEVLSKKLPAVFVVCNHADEPYCTRSPPALAKEIFGDLKGKPCGAQLFDVFCVDNTKSGTKSECEEIMQLREKVHGVAKGLAHVNEPIPIKWLKYENALGVIRENDRKLIFLSTAKQIASNVCKINKNNEISSLLNFLHDLRVFIHFDDTPELSEVVFMDIQWLIDVYKNVITVRAYHEENNFGPLWKRTRDRWNPGRKTPQTYNYLGDGHKSLVLPHKFNESLDPPDHVVRRLLHNLKLDDATLEHPKPEAEKWIRCLSRHAKDHKRTDVVEYLREIMPTGTAGPLLPEALPVQDIPESQLMRLTITLGVEAL